VKIVSDEACIGDAEDRAKREGHTICTALGPTRMRKIRQS
jgi:hypothetical protein